VGEYFNCPTWVNFWVNTLIDLCSNPKVFTFLKTFAGIDFIRLGYKYMLEKLGSHSKLLGRKIFDIRPS